MAVSKEIEKAIFSAALELDDPQLRAAFLDQACNGDPSLRTHLKDLLAVHNSAKEFFDVPPVQVFECDPQHAGPGVVPDSARKVAMSESVNVLIDRYLLLQRIGEGGCGVVYLAEQQRPVRRRVALKIIRLGMDTESVIARF